MSYTRAWSSDLGLVAVPWQSTKGAGLMQFALSGGLNYTRLVFADEYQDFIESTQPFIFNDDAASGFGWYAGPEFQYIVKNGFIMHFDVRFIQENPEFPQGTQAFAGSEVLGGFGIGYKF
jgi:hypothetical protein